MAELKYYVESKESGTVYGPMTAGDRGNYVARGYKDVTDQHAEVPAAPEQSSEQAQPVQPDRSTARPVPSQRPVTRPGAATEAPAPGEQPAQG